MTVKSGDDVKVLLVRYHGDGSDMLASVSLARDPETTCLIAKGGRPLALPRGTRLRGSGDDVVVVAPDGTEYRLGDKLYGGGESGNDAAVLKSEYGKLHDICGPPPWAIFYQLLPPSAVH